MRSAIALEVAAKQTTPPRAEDHHHHPRTSGALGYTMQVDEGQPLPDEQSGARSWETRSPPLTGAGGVLPKKGKFHPSPPVRNDIEQATALACAMLTYGMSDEFG